MYTNLRHEIGERMTLKSHEKDVNFGRACVEFVATIVTAGLILGWCWAFMWGLQVVFN